MNTRLKHGFRLSLLVISLVTAPARVVRAEVAPTDSAANARLEETLKIIQKSYLKPMTRTEVLDRALHALLQDLDPYSYYFDRDEWKLRNADLAAEFCGIGVNMEIDSLALVPRIRNLFAGSAAGAAGVRNGDLILAVDGHALKGLEMNAVRERLIGAADTPVSLTLQRAGVSAPLELQMKRRVVKTPSVRGWRQADHGDPDYFYDEPRGIGYIRISRLSDDTVVAVKAALHSLEARGVKSLILDLRDGMGGYLQAAIGVADLFLDSGTILTTATRTDTTRYDARPGVGTRVPMVGLINAGTGSSSEFLAAALQDNGRVVMIGQRTYGKARIQEKRSLGDNAGGLVLTTGTFIRPAGTSIDRHDGPDAAGKAGVAPAPGMEVVVEGSEYEAWWKDASLRDSGMLLNAADTTPAPPDRMLLRGVELLQAGLNGRVVGSTTGLKH